MRIQTAVWGYDTIAVEVVVAGRITTIVATIGEDFLACDRTLVTKTLVHEVPDISTLILWIFANQVPILLESTLRVTHRMGILTLDVRFGAITLTILLALLIVDVHRTVDVGLAVITTTLILHRTSLVVSLHPVVCLLEVDAIARLIAQTPHDDGRMVHKGLHIALVALDMGLKILRELRQRLLAIAHTMGLQVSLSGDIQTIFIAKVVPARIVRIVTSAHRIDIQLLHDLDVLNHALHTDDITAVWIYLVSVGTLDQDRLAIDQELCVLDFHVAESHSLWNHLRYSLLTTDCDIHLIEIRCLGCPSLHLWHLDGSLRTRGRSHLLAILVAQGNGDVGIATRQRNLVIQHTILIVVLQSCIESNIGNMCLRTGIEIHLTGDSRQTPEVLVLEVRTIAPSHHLHGNQVLARFEILGDIKLGSYLAILAISHIFAIHPKRKVASGRTYVEIHILTLPILRKIKSAAIRTRIVIDLTDIWRIRVKLSSPGVPDVLIGWVAIAIQFKQSRYREVLPVAIIEIRLEEVQRSLVVILHKVKLPRSLHGEIVDRQFLVKALRLAQILESKESCTPRLSILLVDIHIVPTSLVLSRRRHRTCQTQSSQE